MGNKTIKLKVKFVVSKNLKLEQGRFACLMSFIGRHVKECLHFKHSTIQVIVSTFVSFINCTTMSTRDYKYKENY